MENFDVCIIGGGPAGYVAALKSAINGLSTAVIEKDKVGGTCLNRGCIPTKALYSKAKYLSKLKKPENGFTVEKFSYNFEEIITYKDKVVSTLVSGVEKLFKARNISLFRGAGRILSVNGGESGDRPQNRFIISVKSDDGLETDVSAGNIILATGSSPAMIPSFNIDHKNIITSDEILSLKKVPKSLAIIGAGVIGCEFANIFCEFGSNITMMEMLPEILSTEDKEVSRFIRKGFISRGIEIKTAVSVETITSEKQGTAKVLLKDGTTVECEKVLISIGRKLNLDCLGLPEIGVNMDSRGKVIVDGFNETNIKGIYACGDIIDGPMLAHKAAYDGIIAADHIAANKEGTNEISAAHSIKKDYSVLPWSVYTNPAVGTVGLKEGDKPLEGTDCSVGRFSYAANGMALAMEEDEGFLKVTIDKKTKKILGATGCGADIPELIAEIASYMHFGGTIEDVEKTIHSHPTLSEIVPEAAMDAVGEAIHKVNPRTAKK